MGPVLALDPGTRYVGIAISNPERTIAFPLQVLPAEPNKYLIQKLEEIVKERRVAQMVIGRPVAFRGTILPMTKLAERFAQKIEKALHLPVAMVDERLSTKAASATTNSRGRVDAQAAAIFLQTYLEQLQRKEQSHV